MGLCVYAGGVFIRKTTNLTDTTGTAQGEQVDARGTEVGGKLRAPGRLRGAVTLHKSRRGEKKKRRKKESSFGRRCPFWAEFAHTSATAVTLQQQLVDGVAVVYRKHSRAPLLNKS